MHGMGKKINELHAMLELDEKGFPKKDATPAILAIKTGKIQKNNKNKKLKASAKGKNHGNAKKLSLLMLPKLRLPLHQRKSTLQRTQPAIIVMRGSKKLKPGALNLYVRDGHCTAIETIGSFDLFIPNGLCIVLDNCHYAPSITKGVISVSRLEDNGFVNCFVKNHGILVSKDNLVYFYDIPHDGIYEIDLHSSNSNDNSIYLKEVENQLEKTIKVIRSHHGGEFMSQDFFDHIKEYEIVSQRTPPYTPQHNGVSERRNRTFLDMVLSMMSQTTLPKFFGIMLLSLLHAFSIWFQLRRSARIRHAHDRLCLYIGSEEHELGDHHEPTNYKVALSDPESDKWIEPMNVEMQSMKDNKVQDLVDLPPNSKTIGSKWFFKQKTNMDGKVHTYKAHLVAKGFTQTYGVDYKETFSLVEDIKSIRILIAIVVYYDYEIWQMDVKTAFLNGHLTKEVYMVKPGGVCQSKISKPCMQASAVYLWTKSSIKSQDASTPDEVKRMQTVPSASVVGSIMYVIIHQQFLNVSPENKAHYESEKEAIHLLLTGIGDEIYSTVDACKTTHEMWIAIERLQQGESLNIQDVKTNLFWEFGKFTSWDGESMESYYSRFYKMMNEMIRNNLTVATIQVNIQFLQQLQPEWSRHKGKKIAKPIIPPSGSASEEDSDPEQAQKDKEMQKNLALIAKYFKKLYKPTNNNIRTSLNSRNKNVDTTSSQVVQQTGIQCFNCKEFGHFAKECWKPKRVKDSMYHKKKMLLCKQAEKGVPLQAEQSDWLADTDEEIE
ncbi:retrotransposon protein, putative, ty1-copia subclass [Tanacetum coccineum]